MATKNGTTTSKKFNKTIALIKGKERNSLLLTLKVNALNLPPQIKIRFDLSKSYELYSFI